MNLASNYEARLNSLTFCFESTVQVVYLFQSPTGILVVPRLLIGASTCHDLSYLHISLPQCVVDSSNIFFCLFNNA